MGLAGARKRQKISHDPNNTTWARDSSGFGQRILSKQGWTPGSYLGARDAAQSGHFTAASASHIRIALKDDTLGIGAKRTGETAENFGLGALVDIYGRLNGKHESKRFQEEQKARVDLGAKLYAEQRYGPTRFVRGGFLIGDKIEKELIKDDTHTKASTVTVPHTEPSEVDTRCVAATARRKKDKSTSASQDIEFDISAKALTKAERKEDKLRRKEERRQRKSEGESESKEDRRKRKEQRRAYKLAKRALKTGQAVPVDQPEEKASDVTDAAVAEASKPTTTTTTTTTTSALRFGGGRQAVRQRYIQAKKMAGMNPQALREILMARS